MLLRALLCFCGAPGRLLPLSAAGNRPAAKRNRPTRPFVERPGAPAKMPTSGADDVKAEHSALHPERRFRNTLPHPFQPASDVSLAPACVKTVTQEARRCDPGSPSTLADRRAVAPFGGKSAACRAVGTGKGARVSLGMSVVLVPVARSTAPASVRSGVKNSSQRDGVARIKASSILTGVKKLS